MTVKNEIKNILEHSLLKNYSIDEIEILLNQIMDMIE